MAVLIQRALSEGNRQCKEEPLSSFGQGQRALQEGGEADGQVIGNAGQSWANKKEDIPWGISSFVRGMRVELTRRN